MLEVEIWKLQTQVFSTQYYRTSLRVKFSRINLHHVERRCWRQVEFHFEDVFRWRLPCVEDCLYNFVQILVLSGHSWRFVVVRYSPLRRYWNCCCCCCCCCCCHGLRNSCIEDDDEVFARYFAKLHPMSRWYELCVELYRVNHDN